MAPGSVSCPRAAALRLLAVVALLGSSAGTHFRYGSIRWWVGQDSLNGALDINGRPVYQAVFEVKGAWRRDYSWGALFNEAWRERDTAIWRNAPVADGDFSCASVRGTNNPLLSGVQCFEAGTDLIKSAQDFSSYQIKFITGMGFQGLPLPPSGVQCVSPLHKGVVGAANLGQYRQNANRAGPSLGEIVSSGTPNYWAISGIEWKTTADTNDDYDTDLGVMLPAANISAGGVCSPWAETFGFFFGDRDHADEVVVTVTDIDFDAGLVGNTLRATSSLITHNYASPHDTSAGTGFNKPYVAYWTGGNRLSHLRNNADGRFRLEVDVRFLTWGGNIVSNKSPIVTQIPVMPVVYPATGVATFQVAAYDPDYGSRRDQVRFFLGTPQEHGYILANYIRYRKFKGGPVLEEATYWRDVYSLRACELGVAASSICTNGDPLQGVGGKSVVFGPNYAGNGNLTAEGLNSSALYQPWDDKKNYAYPPMGVDGKTLTIDSKSGMVNWRVGTGPYSGIEPGFYQVTIMVEERLEGGFWDSIDPDTSFRTNYLIAGSDYHGGYDITTGNDRVGRSGNMANTTTSKNGGPRVPVDFMMYVYPAMHYCSSNCDRSASGNVLQTFESSTGLYGDPLIENRPGDGLAGPGTGSCKICGGGGIYTSVPGDSGMEYYNITKDDLAYCSVVNTQTATPIQAAYARGYDNFTGVAEYGLWRASMTSEMAWRDYSDVCRTATTSFTNGKNCREDPSCSTQWVFQGCLGVFWDGAASIVPYGGIFETCQINNPPRFITDCDCNSSAWQTQTGSRAKFTPSAQGCLYNMKADGTGLERATFRNCCSNDPSVPLTTADPFNGLYIGMFQTGTIRGILGQPLFFDLVAKDDDQCTELVISDTGFPSEYMVLEPHQRISPNTVTRRFTYNPPAFANGTAERDPRNQFTRVCFYVTDKYLITSYPYHCLNIELVPPVAIKWCDEAASNGDAAPDSSQASATNTIERYKVLRAYIGEMVTLPLCVYKSETPNVQHLLAILPVTEESPGMYPDVYNFSYPVNTINFPPQYSRGPTTQSIAAVSTPGWYFAETLDSTGTPLTTMDPLWRTWTFTPDETQECVYTVCFRGVDLESADLVDPTTTPTQYTSVRCYRIEVYNSVLEFDGENEVQVAGLSESIYIKDGFSMSVWAMPSCQPPGRNMTLMYFGSTRHFQTQQGYYGGDHGLPIRNGLKWAQTHDSHGRFYYEDWRVGIKASHENYACDMWHFVAFTVNEEHEAVLYVDGEQQTRRDRFSSHVSVSTQLHFKTPSRPDTPDDITTGTGVFAAGSYKGEQTMIGQLDDIYVWNRALEREEIGTVMRSRTLAGMDDIQEKLVLWFPMRDGTGGTSLPLPSYSSSTFFLASTTGVPPTVVDSATPVVVPCVRGLEMPVGPTDGTCMQSVYGWNFARAPHTAVRFGDIKVPATFINDTELRVETPGYVSPRFVSVTASNNGATFTDTSGVGRDVKFLYLDAGLYMDGTGGGGQADSVCVDLRDRSVTFGAWVCVDCGQPEVDYKAPDPGMPNAKPEGEPQPPIDQIYKPLYDMGLAKPRERKYPMA